MKKLLTEAILSRIFGILSIVLFTMLFLFSFLMSWVNQWDLQEEYVTCVSDSVWHNLLGIIIALLIFGVISYLEKRHPLPCNMDVVAGAISILQVVFSVYWVMASDTSPNGDQHAICLCAEEFEMGDFSRLEQSGYVGIYPQQLGMITFTRLLYRIFGLGNYQAFQYFNALMVGLLVFSGYHVLKRLSAGNKQMAIFYLLLMSVCVPMYGYVPFVYGELGSTALMMFGAWMILDLSERFSIVKVVALGLAAGCAVQLRKNVLVFIVAFFIVQLIRFFRGNKKQIILTCCGMLLGVVLCQGIIDGIYGQLMSEDSHGVPNIAYIAMGVNDDNGNAGWHNNFDRNVFEDNGYDVEIATIRSKEYLAQFWETCKANPKYALDFYYRKFVMQWNAPMYQCLAMNNLLGENRNAFAEDVYFGNLRDVVEKHMNIYQLLVYGSVLFLLIRKQKEWISIERYILLIAVFGGFLFSILWEAKTRYVLPYFIIMIPYAAMGIYELLVWIRCKTIIRRKSKE